MRDSEHRQYSKDWLQYERQQPMYDKSINEFYANIFKITPVCKNSTDIDKDFLSTQTVYGADYGREVEEVEEEAPKAKDESGADFLRHN